MTEEIAEQLKKNREYMGQLLERNIIGSILYNMYRLVDTVATESMEEIERLQAENKHLNGIVLSCTADNERLRRLLADGMRQPAPVSNQTKFIDLELALLRMWSDAGIKEIYKYKNRIKIYKREGLCRFELFYDLSHAMFTDVEDTANGDDLYADDCKASVEMLIKRREIYGTPPLSAIKQGDKDLLTAKEEIARINCDYYADKQRFHKQARELEEAKGQANKLREAIETAINEKAAWGDPGNALDVVTRYLADVLDSLYPKEEDRGKTNL
ncbi:hypothetical protein ABDI30_23535 [Paenibacillus cisolokensis]|uniref:hypothetical protein n=1 Tax=Paenibacillus cisolokensis TaxID=1658519 RepID=UPI003D28FC97